MNTKYMNTAQANVAAGKAQFNLIDVSKFVFSIFVIAIHCTSFGQNDRILNNFFVEIIVRLAVPFFFACSGYFFFSSLIYKDGKIVNCKANRKKLFTYIKRLIILYAFWSAIYLLWQIPSWYVEGWLSARAFIDYIIAFFRSGSYYHLWYLLDLIYASIFGYIMLMIFKKKLLIYIAAVLYLAGLLSYSYYWLNCAPVYVINEIAKITQSLWNSASRAFPLMFFGYYFASLKKNFSKNKNLTLFLFSFAFLIVETFINKNYTPNSSNTAYLIFTVPCEIFCFLTLLSIVIKGNKNIYISMRNSSTVIYCIHPLIINLLGLFNWVNSNYILFNFFLVVLISVVLSLIIVRISKIKGFRFLKLLY